MSLETIKKLIWSSNVFFFGTLYTTRRISMIKRENNASVGIINGLILVTPFWLIVALLIFL